MKITHCLLWNLVEDPSYYWAAWLAQVLETLLKLRATWIPPSIISTPEKFETDVPTTKENGKGHQGAASTVHHVEGHLRGLCLLEHIPAVDQIDTGLQGDLVGVLPLHALKVTISFQWLLPLGDLLSSVFSFFDVLVGRVLRFLTLSEFLWMCKLWQSYCNDTW